MRVKKATPKLSFTKRFWRENGGEKHYQSNSFIHNALIIKQSQTRLRPTKKIENSNIKIIDQHNVQTVKTLIIQLKTTKSIIDQIIITELKNVNFMVLLI